MEASLRTVIRLEGRLESSVVFTWNCSQQGLWIIFCNWVMISGKRRCCWVFQVYFLQTSLQSMFPKFCNSPSRWVISTTGKSTNMCLILRWNVTLIKVKKLKNVTSRTYRSVSALFGPFYKLEMPFMSHAGQFKPVRDPVSTLDNSPLNVI